MGKMRVLRAGNDACENKKILIWYKFIVILDKLRASMLDKKKKKLTVVVTKMEATCYSKLFLNLYKVIQSHILKDSNFQNFSC
jgi:hypothetical protein